MTDSERIETLEDAMKRLLVALMYTIVAVDRAVSVEDRTECDLCLQNARDALDPSKPLVMPDMQG